MIGTKFYKPLQDDQAVGASGNMVDNPADNTYQKYAQAAEWCNSNNATIQDKGEYYEVVAVPEPSEDEKREIVKRHLEAVVQAYLDKGAQALSYDSILAASSYIGCGVEKYETEAVAFTKWKAATWSEFYSVYAKIENKQIDIPTNEQLIEMLPKLVIEYVDNTTFVY